MAMLKYRLLQELTCSVCGGRATECGSGGKSPVHADRAGFNSNGRYVQGATEWRDRSLLVFWRRIPRLCVGRG